MSHHLDPMKDLFEWTSVRWEKCLALYALATAALGPIVELGAYDGNGTIALALGAKAGNNVPVYGVDQWLRFTGLYQQQFYPEDKLTLIKNAAAAGVTVIPVQGDIVQVGIDWQHGPVSMVVWDVSLPRLLKDFSVWQHHIMPGGLFVAKDTSVFDFGWQDVIQAAPGWPVFLEKPEACLWAIQKPYSG